MVDMEWPYSFGIFLSFYAITWILFSSVYWVVAHLRGDLEFYIAVNEIRNQSEIDVVTLSLGCKKLRYSLILKVDQKVD